MELRVEDAMSLATHMLSASRLKHTLGVADYAEELARRHGVDPIKARCAGLAHDLSKELPAQEQLGLARFWNLFEYPEDEQYPYVLHGRLSAYWLEHYFKIDDRDLLAAIASHTLGRPGMSRLEMLIYSADLTEPNRTFPEVDKLRQSLYDDLDRGTLDCVEGTLIYLKESNHPIHPLTQLTYDDLKRRLTVGN
ncbi:bis(5'-nucleosyl)-tetraphosphatase (symmetrical) YqeK [Desulfosporosinus sp. SB140]|uniref:bis(5'-nucleosyl)-tetraphosphatase (symmetrical) YqeK n=1 Tax=Desulfosporosinus paludis TaxID=3115649 RepID=UPI00388FD3E0